jgi:phage tail sheath protein FI
VAAPGSTFRGAASSPDDALAISRSLVEHAERAQHRFALLDLPDGLSRAQAIAWRGQFDSPSAALYHPWLEVRAADEVGRRRMPPSGAVAGLYARTDLEQGVHKAPARALLRSAVGLEAALAPADERALGEAGVNVLSALSGRGIGVVGARTTSNESAWKYVHVRRYCLYVEASLRKGLQWVVFEANGEALWAAVRSAVESLLAAEWRRGALLGARPEEAWFVRCDRATMTQDDLDHGRLVCLVGLATLRPAEFVILRIGHVLASGGSSA